MDEIIEIDEEGKVHLKNNPFTLTDNEVEALYNYFIMRAGYISYEFDPFIIVLIKRLNQHIEEIEK